MDFIENQPPVSEDRVKEVEENKLCVVRALESIASDIRGENLKFTPPEKDIRIKQIIETEDLTKKRLNVLEDVGDDLRGFFEREEMKKNSPKLLPIVGRLDKMNIERLISDVKKGDSEIARVLNQSEIKYVTGNLTDAKKYLDQGWRVGLTTADIIGGELLYEDVHFFHLGRADEGILTDKSDEGYTKKEIDLGLLTGNLEKKMIELQKLTTGWNMVLVRPS